MDHGANSYARYLRGDDEGLVELVRDYKDGLVLFLCRYVGDLSLAEELAEDTFFRLVTRKPRFTAKYSFKTWLYTIGKNVALNHLKKAGRQTALPEQLPDEETETLERAYLREERRIAVHRALSRLREDYGQVLYLKFFEDLTNEQAAKVMGKNRRQIENLLYQAKAALRRQLEKEDVYYEEL